MTHPFIPRRLRQRHRDGEFLLTDEDILGFEDPVVVLGEAGMGKTTLMRHLAERANAPFVDARSFVRRSDAGAGESPGPGRAMSR